MMKSIISAAGLIAAASAYTQPTAQTYGSLLTPDLNTPVTTGQDYTITWSPKQPADGVTVSLVLCNGPGANCVLQSAAIVEKVPASAGSYKWSVPCSLSEGVASSATGYGMLIIVDGTGEFQYSTQFSVNKGASCSSSTTTTTTTSSSSTTGATTSTTSGAQGSTTTSASGKPSSSPVSDGWYGWSSTGFNTTTVPAETTTSKYTTGPAAVTTQASASYVKPSSAAASATASTSATPKPFTGAATVPTTFVNVVGFVGAAALAMFAL